MNPNNPLDRIARDLVGDGRAPNLFFVSVEGRGVLTVTENADLAYSEWASLARVSRRLLPLLEDRLHGTIADVCKNEDGHFQLNDDYKELV